LARAVLIARNVLAADEETYRYDASSLRVVKLRTEQTSGTLRRNQVLYLPGLELRAQYSDATVESSRHEIIVGAAGSAQVRVLHWETGLPPGMANDSIRYSHTDLIGSVGLELDKDANLISQEEYYPYGETAVWLPHNTVEADYKTVRYSGKERDVTGLYYYGYRYYQPWLGRWLSADPAGTVDGLNLYQMVQNSPITFKDRFGLTKDKEGAAADRKAAKRATKNFKALKGAQSIIENTEIELRNFVSSKREHITGSAFHNATLEVLSSSLAFTLSELLGGVDRMTSVALGVSVDTVLKKVIPPMNIAPDIDMAAQIEDASASMRERVKANLDEIFGVDNMTNQFIDFSTNEFRDIFNSAIGASYAAPSIPLAGLVGVTRDVANAIPLEKDEVLAEAKKNISHTRYLLKGLGQALSDEFARSGIPVFKLDGKWIAANEEEFDLSSEMELPTIKHEQLRMLKLSEFGQQYLDTMAQLDHFEATVNRLIKERQAKHVSH
jgi:insecticidal toxin complex protein TccC